MRCRPALRYCPQQNAMLDKCNNQNNILHVICTLCTLCSQQMLLVRCKLVPTTPYSKINFIGEINSFPRGGQFSTLSLMTNTCEKWVKSQPSYKCMVLTMAHCWKGKLIKLLQVLPDWTTASDCWYGVHDCALACIKWQIMAKTGKQFSPEVTQILQTVSAMRQDPRKNRKRCLSYAAGV